MSENISVLSDAELDYVSAGNAVKVFKKWVKQSNTATITQQANATTGAITQSGTAGTGGVVTNTATSTAVSAGNVQLALIEQSNEA